MQKPLRGSAAIFEQLWRSSEKECAELQAEIDRLKGVSSLQAAIRYGELNANALIESSLVVRDLHAAIRNAIAAIDRKSFETARQVLKQALDESPWREKRERQA